MHGTHDREWHTIVPLVLGPHPKLSESHKRAIELDYGMKDGEVESAADKRSSSTRSGTYDLT